MATRRNKSSSAEVIRVWSDNEVIHFVRWVYRELQLLLWSLFGFSNHQSLHEGHVCVPPRNGLQSSPGPIVLVKCFVMGDTIPLQHSGNIMVLVRNVNHWLTASRRIYGSMHPLYYCSCSTISFRTVYDDRMKEVLLPKQCPLIAQRK